MCKKIHPLLDFLVLLAYLNCFRLLSIRCETFIIYKFVAN